MPFLKITKQNVRKLLVYPLTCSLRTEKRIDMLNKTIQEHVDTIGDTVKLRSQVQELEKCKSEKEAEAGELRKKLLEKEKDFQALIGKDQDDEPGLTEQVR